MGTVEAAVELDESTNLELTCTSTGPGRVEVAPPQWIAIPVDERERTQG